MKTNYERAMIITLLCFIAAIQTYTAALPRYITIGFIILTGIYFMIVIVRFSIRILKSKQEEQL